MSEDVEERERQMVAHRYSGFSSEYRTECDRILERLSADGTVFDCVLEVLQLFLSSVETVLQFV
jgi:hypothetical protein